MNTYSFRKDLLAVQEELLRFAYKLTADREEANDLLQETSLKALDNEDKFEPDTNFRGWMYTIMTNKVTTKKWNTEECSNRIDLQRFHLSCRFSPTPPQSLQKPNQDVATLLVRNHTI